MITPYRPAKIVDVTGRTNCRLSPRLGGQDKINYDGHLNRLEGVVSNDHLFDVYLGECIAPYVALDPLEAALPVHRPTMTMPLNHDDCEGDRHDACCLEVAALHSTMQRRWNNAAEMYREAHTNQAIKDLYSRLNHQNILTSQLKYLRSAIAGDETVRVAYTQSGQPTAAVIRDSNSILDHVLFQTICHSVTEAYYVLAVINSDTLAAAAETFMARGCTVQDTSTSTAGSCPSRATTPTNHFTSASVNSAQPPSRNAMP